MEDRAAVPTRRNPSVSLTETPPPPPATPASDWKAPAAPPPTPRPFWKKKRFIIPAALVALIIAVPKGDEKDPTAVNSGQVSETSATTAATAPVDSDPAPAKPAATATTAKAGSSRLYPGRADAQEDDHEATMGQ